MSDYKVVLIYGSEITILDVALVNQKYGFLEFHNHIHANRTTSLILAVRVETIDHYFPIERAREIRSTSSFKIEKG